ncbi:MAG: nuclear transport factor 2 family protein [Sphingomonadales bacterium]|nr:nuclear transport factor 2 family protein [Sphingomonadales bacterium]MDE2570314.1 nuclear transport factor 2 family protein [Sphingomonadales bacterium]
MRANHFLTFTAVLAAASATTALAKPARDPVFNAKADVDAVRQVEEILATEIDIDKVMPLYSDGAVVLDLFSPGVYRGKDEIRAGFAPQLAAIRSMKKTTPEMTIATDGRFACAASQIAYQTVMKDGTEISMNVRVLDALEKVGGTWLVVQQHLSFPVDPNTLMALTTAPIEPRSLTWSEHPLAPVSTTPAKARAQIREWMDVGGASIGLEKLMNYYGPGDDTLLYDAFSPKALIGKKEIAEFYGPIMDSYNGISLAMPLFAADSDGSFGIQIDTQHLTLDMKDGTKRNIALRQSDCMRRVGDKWYSFMEMVSYPVDAKTMKAHMAF